MKEKIVGRKVQPSSHIIAPRGSFLVGLENVCSAKPSGLSFRFQQRQDVPLAYRPFYVSNQLPVLLVQKLHFDLSALALGSSSSEDFNHSGPHDRLFHFIEAWSDSSLRFLKGRGVSRRLSDPSRYSLCTLSAAIGLVPA